jgi:hypothetical protein
LVFIDYQQQQTHIPNNHSTIKDANLAWLFHAHRLATQAQEEEEEEEIY